MFNDYVCKASAVSARDILKTIITEDARFMRIPSASEAERIADELMRERNLYVRPDYLLEVWMEVFKG